MGFLGLFSSKHSLVESGILNGSIDRHSHILFGVDDGIMTPEDSLEALAYEESLGVKEVWCTPHIMEDVPNTTAFLKSRFEELQGMYQGRMKLYLAAEYMIDTLFEDRLRNADLLLMEDDMVLMETSTLTPPYDLKGSLAYAMSSGYRPLFAHPERCRYMQLEDYEELIKMGVRMQLNVASLTGYYGHTAKEKAEILLKKGMYYAYGSDCHRVKVLKQQYTRQEISRTIAQRLQDIA